MKHLAEGTRIAGCAVPVFSLRSKGSFGVGDFGDLKMMIDWVARTGQKILQILPINDSTNNGTWTDSYPYSAISIYALHPMYVDLRQLTPLWNAVDVRRFKSLQKKLNTLPQVDYEAVNQAKLDYLYLLFQRYFDATRPANTYKQFIKDTKFWLDGYVKYCVRRDKRIGAPKREADFYRYIQFILDKQMRSAHEHAKKLGVMLKGDIPIGVNRYGSDVEIDPRYFNMNGQAGAPPDSFSKNGQNWEFPTYNWDEMMKDGLQWWIRRFQNMARYFDAYRIDHVLGFFRIWEVPLDSVTALLGQFQPSLGLSMDEIHGYGLWLDEKFMTEPFIADWVLERIFGDDAQYVRKTFLVHQHDDIWALKPKYNTQRKVEAWFRKASAPVLPKGKGKVRRDADSLGKIRDGLFSLISNVLFVRDHKRPELFHPRISVQMDTVYETLWQHDKDNFNRLYDDYFYRRNNDFWYDEAMKKLPVLCDSTDMLACAEDLGMVPDCVPWVLNQLQILSLELISMPKDIHHEFGILDHNPWRSVCTISSHDTPTMRMWWDENPERTQRFYNQYLGNEGSAPHPMPEWIATDMVQRHLWCPSALCIITLQDWLACSEALRLADANAERINDPSNTHNYWRYRMHLNLEDLLEANDFNDKISEMIKKANR